MTTQEDRDHWTHEVDLLLSNTYSAYSEALKAARVEPLSMVTLQRTLRKIATKLLVAGDAPGMTLHKINSANYEELAEAWAKRVRLLDAESKRFGAPLSGTGGEL
jgi:hypothetical protein